jgi:hypothetical protein
MLKVKKVNANDDYTLLVELSDGRKLGLSSFFC